MLLRSGLVVARVATDEHAVIHGLNLDLPETARGRQSVIHMP